MIQYKRNDCIVFWKTKEENGGLSNMAGGYIIRMDDITVRTSEHLYQALKYTDHPDIQEKICAIASPLFAKKYANKFKNTHIRKDWENIKIPVMEWCINLKLLNNLETFGKLLFELEDKPIVEFSKKDNFWGAIPDITGEILTGTNTLGKLLKILYDKCIDGFDPHMKPIIDIPDFNFYGENAVELSLKGLNKIYVDNDLLM